MRTIKLNALFFVCAGAMMAAGCGKRVTVADRLNTWIGHPIDDMIARIGTPSEILQSDDKTRIFSWNSTAYQTLTTPATVVNAGSRNRPIPMTITPETSRTTSRTEQLMFWVVDGKITRWAIKR